MCATARLFIDHMLPDVDAGIFLDTDILLMDNIKVAYNKTTCVNTQKIVRFVR